MKAGLPQFTAVALYALPSFFDCLQQLCQLPEWARDWGPHTIASKKRCSLDMLSADLQLKTLLSEEEIIQEAKGCILECLVILEKQLQFKSASSGGRIPEFKFWPDH